MQIKHDYLKNLLDAFESAETPSISINDLEEAKFLDDEHAFVFHMRILKDLSLIQRADGGAGFGLVPSNIDNEYLWTDVPLRLTADGHQFLEALRNQEVWTKLKSDFKDASLGTLWKVSRELLEGITKKKVIELLDV